MQNFFQRPRTHFNGLAWTVLIGFRTVAGPFRYGNDAETALLKLKAGTFPPAGLASSCLCSLVAWT